VGDDEVAIAINTCCKKCQFVLPVAIIDSSCTSGTPTLVTYHSNFIARDLYAQKCLKYRKIQYWPTGVREGGNDAAIFYTTSRGIFKQRSKES